MCDVLTVVHSSLARVIRGPRFRRIGRYICCCVDGFNGFGFGIRLGVWFLLPCSLLRFLLLQCFELEKGLLENVHLE